MPDSNIIGVPVRTTNKGFTILVLLGVMLMVTLAIESFQIYTFDRIMLDGITLLLVGAFVAAELGVRLPTKGKWSPQDSLNIVALAVVALTMLYGIVALAGWIPPESLLGIRGFVLGIAAALGLYGLFTR